MLMIISIKTDPLNGALDFYEWKSQLADTNTDTSRQIIQKIEIWIVFAHNILKIVWNHTQFRL